MKVVNEESLFGFHSTLPFSDVWKQNVLNKFSRPLFGSAVIIEFAFFTEIKLFITVCVTSRWRRKTIPYH